jgi:hypothetical protein
MATDERNSFHELRRAGVVAVLFTLCLVGVGAALAGDVPQSNAGGTLSGGVSATSPKIYWFDLDANTTGNASQNGRSLDVLTTYRFNVTVFAANGWENVSAMYFNVWYDNGSTSLTYTGQGAWSNYKANLSYSNPSQASSPTLAQWSVGFGNVQYIAPSSWIQTNAAGYNYTFGIAFKLRQQMHHATTPATPSTTGYANLRSWNAQFGVVNTTGAAFVQSTNTTGRYLEFGIYQYTSLSLSTSAWTATGIAPGSSGTTNIVTVTYSSNGNFSANITLSSLLTSGSNTIPASGTFVKGGSVGTFTAYSTTGSAGTIYLYGTGTGSGTTTYVLQSATANSQTFTIQFQITVPLGTAVGTYRAPVVLTLSQASSP